MGQAHNNSNIYRNTLLSVLIFTSVALTSQHRRSNQEPLPATMNLGMNSCMRFRKASQIQMPACTSSGMSKKKTSKDGHELAGGACCAAMRTGCGGEKELVVQSGAGWIVGYTLVLVRSRRAAIFNFLGERSDQQLPGKGRPDMEGA